MLYDRSLQTVQKIGSVDWNRANTSGVFDAQVNGGYAVWTRCTGRFSCQIKLRDLTAGTTTTVPTKLGKVDYASSVGADGTVFFARSGHGCGASVRLRSYTLGGADSLLVAFQNGIDVNSTNTYSGATADDVYYSKYRCRASTYDLYKVSSPLPT
jgi:hypothetical protein